jgi:PAT family beta-lactamase induction signal transducer AmpG
MVLALLMGFASGLPLLLTGSVLQAWLREGGVDLTHIGLFALIGLPYTLKFLWAPLLDRYQILGLGRRRGWLIVAQCVIAAGLLVLSMNAPNTGQLLGVMGASFLVTFFSATQDIVVDAYRRESLAETELGLGSALYVNGYRLGMLLAGGGGLILADWLSFPVMYRGMGLCMLACVVVTWYAPEPLVPSGAPQTLRAAVVEPFLDYFARPGAWLMLAFILLYKLGDTMAAAMTTPFYLDLGFSKTEIGSVVKLFGFWATLAGGTLGGIWILRVGVARALIWFGLAQMLSTLGFVLLSQFPYQIALLALVVTVENVTAGMGTTVFVGFMAALTDRRFTATQYALLSSLMGVPRVLLSAPTGWFAEVLGWPLFFLSCALLAVPGLLLLKWVLPLSGTEQPQDQPPK